MEEFVKKQRIRTVTIGAQWLDKFRHPQVQAFEVIGASLDRLDVHIMASGTADVANA